MTDNKSKNKQIVIDKPEQPSTFVEEAVQAPLTNVPSDNNSETFTDPEQVDADNNNDPTISFKKDPPKIITLETPIGTEMELTEDQAKKLLSGEGEKSKFETQLNEILVNVSQERLDEITDGLKKGIIKLKYVDKNKVVPNNIDYVPITFGQNKEANKVMKRSRLLREDIKECVDGKITIKDLAAKYPQLLDEDTGLEELQNKAYLNEVVGNYVITEKARIYWGIDDVQKYVLSDLILLITLFERRNSYTNI